MSASTPFRLCAVTTDAAAGGRGHTEVALAALAGGVDAVQLRAPGWPAEDLRPLAAVLTAACARTGAALIVNDHPEVAAAVGAAGAHVGQDDDPFAARARLSPGQILGVSAGDLDEVEAAVAAGADYLGVTVWPTATKAEASAVGVEGLGRLSAASPVPLVAIGGVSAATAPTALAAGAAGVAVVSAIAGAPDPVAAARELRAIVDRACAEDPGGAATTSELPPTG